MSDTSERLSATEVSTTVRFIQGIARMAMTLDMEDVTALMAQMSLEEAMLPMFDPTLYMQTRDQTRWHRPYLEAFATYRKALQKIAEEEGVAR